MFGFWWLLIGLVGFVVAFLFGFWFVVWVLVGLDRVWFLVVVLFDLLWL